MRANPYPVSVVVYRGDNEDLFLRTVKSVRRQAIEGIQVLIVAPALEDAAAVASARAMLDTTVADVAVLGLESPLTTTDRNRAIRLTSRAYVCELHAGVVLDPSAIEMMAWGLETRPTAGAYRLTSTISLIRREAWDQSGGLDERLPAEAADDDLTRRIGQHHWTTAGTAGATAPSLPRRPRGTGLRVLRRLEARIRDKLDNDELTDPALVLRHPWSSLLRLMPTRFKGKRWNGLGLPHRPNPWIDVPVLRRRPDGWRIPSGVHPPASDRSRLLIIHSELVPGGAETVLLNLVTFIDHDHFDIHIITTDSLPGQPIPNAWAPRFAEQQVGIYDLPSFLEPDWHLRFVVDFINSREIDVVVISLSRFAYNSLAQIRRACPSAAIVDLLHAEAPYYPMDHVRLAKQHRQYLDRRVVVSDALRSLQVSKYGETPERVVLIRNGVDTEGLFNPALYQRGPFRRALGISDDVVIVLWFGRLVIEKQPMHIVEVAKRLRRRSEIVFVLLGDGPDKPAFERTVAELGLENLIVRPARDHIEQAVADADLVLFPSKREGVPMSGIEAMAMATPVVAAQVPGWNELISDGVDGFLIADGDFDSYSDAVARLVDDPTLRARMGAAGRRKAVSAYDVRDFASAWEQLFHEPRLDQQVG